MTYGVLIEPLPWPDADRIVTLDETRDGGASPFGRIMTNGSYYAWRGCPSRTIDALAAWNVRTMTLAAADGGVDRVEVVGATADLFRSAQRLFRDPALVRRSRRRFRRQLFLCRVPWLLAVALRRERPTPWAAVIQLDGRTRTRLTGVMPAAFAVSPTARRGCGFLSSPGAG